MSLRTTLILLVLVALLGGLFLLKRDDQPAVGPTAPPTLLGDLPQGFVTERIELQHALSHEMSAFARRDGVWWLVEPFEDRAAPEAMEHLLGVLQANPKERVDPAPSLDLLAKLGLEPPAGRVALIAGDGRAWHVRVGERDATGQYVHCMFEGDAALYRTGANLRNAIDRPRAEWRDPRFLTGGAEFVRRVELLRPDHPRLVLERSGIEWLMTEPVHFEADAGVVGNTMLGGLMRMRIQRFGAVDPDAERLLEVQLDEAHATVLRLDLGSRTVEARFGLQAGDAGAPRFATDGERGHVFEVEGPDTLRLLRQPEKAFRDPDVCPVTLSACRWLRLTGADGEVKFEMDYDDAARRFRFVVPFDRPVDDSRNGELHTWFLDLRALRAQRSEPGVERESFVDAAELGGQERLDELFSDPAAIVELEQVDPSGVARRQRLEFWGEEGEETLWVRTEHHPGTAYVVPARDARKVIGADARRFLAREVLPGDINRLESFRVQLGDHPMRHMRRKSQGAARSWYDPQDPEAATAAMQEYLSQVITLPAIGFLDRDPLPEDGFEPPRAWFEVETNDPGYFGGKFRLEFGNLVGGEVLARATDLGRRVVFRLDARAFTELEKLFAAP